MVTPSYRDNPAAIELWESTISRLADPIDPGFVREFQLSTLSQPVPPLEGFLEDDVAGELDKIRTPTLNVWGARDALCSRRDQDVLLAAIGGARLVEYDNAGHALHWEEPARIAGDLVAFARTLGVGG